MTDKLSGKAINWTLLLRRLHQFLKPIALLLKIAVALGLIAILLLIDKYLVSSTKVNNALVIQYLAVLRWPISIIIVYLLLRGHLPGLLGRMTELSTKGAKFADPQPTPSTPELSGAADAESDTGANEVDLTNPEGRAQVLQNSEIKWELERIYRIIFGTQIEALSALLSYPGGLSSENLKGLYEKHKRLFPNTTYSNLIELLKYPSRINLLSHDPSTDVFKITDVGRLFLEYLDSEGLLNPIVKTS